MKMYKYIILWVLVLSSVTCIFADREKLVNKNKLYGFDYRLFQKTVAWDLAKAVQDKDTKSIEDNVRVKKIPVDFQEKRFGHTLLMIAIKHNHYESAKKLLELGAKPNKKSNALASNYTPMFYAAEVKDVKYLKLLIKHGGNPNEITKSKNTPLLEACSHSTYDSIGHIKALVEAGANVNYKTPYGHTPLSLAITMDQMGVVLYLLHKGVDYKVVFNTVKRKDRYIQDKLRLVTLPLGSTQYKEKMKVVDFLKKKGIDYWTAPIPKTIVNFAKRKYPNSWQEYLKKY